MAVMGSNVSANLEILDLANLKTPVFFIQSIGSYMYQFTTLVRIEIVCGVKKIGQKI